MPDNFPKKTRRKKSASSKTKKQTDGRDQEIPGLIPQMNALADQLPDEFKPHAKRIIGIFGLVVIAMIAIFIIGAFVATLTDNPNQMFTIFPTYIYGVGAVAVAAIGFTLKRGVNSS